MHGLRALIIGLALLLAVAVPIAASTSDADIVALSLSAVAMLVAVVALVTTPDWDEIAGDLRALRVAAERDEDSPPAPANLPRWVPWGFGFLLLLVFLLAGRRD